MWKPQGRLWLVLLGSSAHRLDQSLCLHGMVPGHCSLSLAMQNEGDYLDWPPQQEWDVERLIPSGKGCWLTKAKCPSWFLLLTYYQHYVGTICLVSAMSQGQHCGLLINVCWVMTELPSLWTLVLFFYWIKIIVYLPHMVRICLRKTGVVGFRKARSILQTALMVVNQPMPSCDAS